MWARSSSVRSDFFVRSSSTMRRPSAWPVDSPEPSSFWPTDCDSSVSSQRSSSAGDMLTASWKSRRTVSGSASCAMPASRGSARVGPRVGSCSSRYRRWVVRKRTDVAGAAVARGQTPEEVLDRNLAELLQEMRVAITGVQILFAFLLTLPFSARFDELGAFGTTVYAVTLLSTATAMLVLIAPVSFHRTLFRQRRKQELVAFADGALLVGLALLLLGIAAAVLLVLDVVLGRWPALACGAAVVVLGVVAWYVVPLRHRRPRDG